MEFFVLRPTSVSPSVYVYTAGIIFCVSFGHKRLTHSIRLNVLQIWAQFILLLRHSCSETLTGNFGLSNGAYSIRHNVTLKVILQLRNQELVRRGWSLLSLSPLSFVLPCPPFMFLPAAKRTPEIQLGSPGERCGARSPKVFVHFE